MTIDIIIKLNKIFDNFQIFWNKFKYNLKLFPAPLTWYRVCSNRKVRIITYKTAPKIADSLFSAGAYNLLNLLLCFINIL
jgi:hypothetical protein